MVMGYVCHHAAAAAAVAVAVAAAAVVLFPHLGNIVDRDWDFVVLPLLLVVGVVGVVVVVGGTYLLRFPRFRFIIYIFWSSFLLFLWFFPSAMKRG